MLLLSLNNLEEAGCTFSVILWKKCSWDLSPSYPSACFPFFSFLNFTSTLGSLAFMCRDIPTRIYKILEAVQVWLLSLTVALFSPSPPFSCPSTSWVSAPFSIDSFPTSFGCHHISLFTLFTACLSHWGTRRTTQFKSAESMGWEIQEAIQWS